MQPACITNGKRVFLGKSRMVSNSFESKMIFTLSLQKMNGTKEGPYAYQVTGGICSCPLLGGPGSIWRFRAGMGSPLKSRENILREGKSDNSQQASDVPDPDELRSVLRGLED